MKKFTDFNLAAPIVDAITLKGYTNPTPIQEQSIPIVMAKKDLLGIAQTGTGKTAAFCLPLIHNFLQSRETTKRNHCQVLILTPTRELASQIEQNILEYSKGTGLTTKVIFGGVSVNPQKTALRAGIDFLVATPGRLLDHISQGNIKFSQLGVFVLDEADRMLDMGFLKDVQKIINKLPKKKHTLLFSATMPKEINSLAMGLLDKPEKVSITPESTTVDRINQKLLTVKKVDKRNLLSVLLEDDSLSKVLVFSRTKHGCDRLVKHLSKSKIHSVAIHGNKSQNARERSLKEFTQDKARVLIATDIAARGIDIKNISHVINFDLPQDAESYVHRIGRTARAKTDGSAISFCDESELKLLKSIEKTIKMKIPWDKEHKFNAELSELKTLSESLPTQAQKQQMRTQARNARNNKRSTTKKSSQSKSKRRSKS